MTMRLQYIVDVSAHTRTQTATDDARGAGMACVLGWQTYVVTQRSHMLTLIQRSCRKVGSTS
eukprot:5198952-Alexandrium_andersonii.AAC.1